MPVSLVLYQPDIPQNTGTLMRLAACFSTPLHVIHPTGFAFSDAKMRRAGMDYALKANLTEHDSYSAFCEWRKTQPGRLLLLTTHGDKSLYHTEFRADDMLMLGRESAGVPEDVANAADETLRIPMSEGLRSINVAVAGALALGEAKRQTGEFENLS